MTNTFYFLRSRRFLMLLLLICAMSVSDFSYSSLSAEPASSAARKRAAKKKAAARKKAKKKAAAAKKKAKKQNADYKKDVRNEYADYQAEVARINEYNRRVTKRQHRDIENTLGLSGKVGYSALFPATQNDLFRPKAAGGIGGGVGLDYTLRYEHFLFHTGVDFDLFNSATRVTSPDGSPLTLNYKLQSGSDPYRQMDYTYRFDRMSDQQLVGYVQLPLMFGAEFSRYFFLIGPKVGLNVIGSSLNTARVTTVISDPTLIGDFTDMPNHGAVSNQTVQGEKTKLNFGLNCSAALEAGIYLDEWIQPAASKSRKLTPAQEFARKLRMRLSLFAEYGFLNVQQASNVTRSDLSVPAAINTADPLSIKPFSPLQVGKAAKDKVNPFMIGVKLAVLYTLPRRQEKLLPIPPEPVPRMAIQVLNADNDRPVAGAMLTLLNIERERTINKTVGSKGLALIRQPRGNYSVTVDKPGFISDTVLYDHQADLQDTLWVRLKPVPKPIEYFLAGYVQDNDTRMPLEAQITIQDMGGKQLYNGVAADDGLFTTSLKAGQYITQLTLAGYMPATDTVTFERDTITLSMQRVKEGKRVRINNLFFATGKTVILPESEQALEELSRFLTENPTVHILILGHTDNVGSDAANMKLSAGRAQAVRNDLIMRGVAPERITAEGRGESEPIADNETEEGRALNRRVEFTITATGGEDIKQIYDNETGEQ